MSTYNPFQSRRCIYMQGKWIYTPSYIHWVSCETSQIKASHVQLICRRSRLVDTRKMKISCITEADLIPPHKISLHHYKQLWHHGSMKKRIRALYRNNKEAYFASFRPAKPDFCSEQEYGMKVFRTCERRIMNQYWESTGEAALLKSVDMLVTRSTTLLPLNAGSLDSELTDIPVLISMDVEGNAWDCRNVMSELGIGYPRFARTLPRKALSACHTQHELYPQQKG